MPATLAELDKVLVLLLSSLNGTFQFFPLLQKVCLSLKFIAHLPAKFLLEISKVDDSQQTWLCPLLNLLLDSI